VTADERLARLYQLRDRLDAEILAAEHLARKSPRRVKKRPRNVIPDCGTESAYQRHRHFKTLPGPDDECGCRAAHAAHNRELERQRKLRRQRMLLGIAS
jgi:ABC-type nickel/cobalt efflux system permease component RcnA